MASGLSVGKLRDQESHAAKALGYPTGDVIYVDSVNGVDGNNGLDKAHPLQTLVRALALASAGDTIVLAPGGSETVTATVAVSLAKLKILCPATNPASGYEIRGAGTLALMTVSAADVHVEGLKFVHTGATASAAGILTTADADRLVVKRCRFDDTEITTTWTGIGIQVTNLCHDVLVDGCVFADPMIGVKFTMDTSSIALRPVVKDSVFFVGRATAFGIATALSGSGGVRGLIVQACAFLEANGLGAAATTAWDGTNGANATVGPIKLEAAADQFLITDCKASSIASVTFANLQAINAGAVGDIVRSDAAYGGSVSTDVTTVVTQTAAVGAVADAAIYTKGTAATDTAIAMLKGLLDMTSGTAGIPTWPASAAPGNAVSIAEALREIYDNLVGTAGIGTFPAAAAPANSVSLAEVIRQIYDQTGIGSEFWIKKTLASSAIPQASVDVTGVSSGGELSIEDVIVKSDATGLAGMTNFELETNNAKGLADFFVTAASGLGASKTIDHTNASVTKIRTVLESGAKVVARASAADGTGAGTVDIYVKFRRLAAAATIAAA